MEAGQLRHRIQIQHKVTGSPQQNAAGEPNTSWSTFLSVWASVDPVTGREPYLTQEHLNATTHKVKVRYRDGITGAMRVLFGDRVFDIKAVLNWGERNRELLLLCEEGLNNG